MNFDLRFPIGIIFTLYGAMLVVYGLMTRHAEMYDIHSLGRNVNLYWGLVLLVFGVFMLFLALRSKKNSGPPKS